MSSDRGIQNVIGLHELSPAYADAVTALGPHEVDRLTNTSVTYYNFFSTGVSLRVCNKTRRVTAMVAYATGAVPGYGPFGGQLPNGLRFGESRDDVTAHLVGLGFHPSQDGFILPGPHYSLSASFDRAGKLSSLSLFT